MKISIILPISNNEILAERAIISLLNQTYKKIEILVGLNGNTQKYDSEIKRKFIDYKQIIFFRIKANNIVDALNYLIDKSKGDYIARMDADDIAHPERLEKQIRYIKYNKFVFVSTNAEIVDTNLDSIPVDQISKSNKFYKNSIIHSSIIVKNTILKKFKYRQIPYAEDYELYLRLEKSKIRLDCIPDKLLFYQIDISKYINPVKAFYQNVATLVVAKAYRNNLIVNENFFKLIKHEKSFNYMWKNYFNSIIINKKLYLKVIFFIKVFFSKQLIMKKILASIFFNKTYQLFYKNQIKPINKKKNYKLKDKFPLITIVIPTFNSEKTIIKTLKSVLKQTYKNFEIIIIDNSFNYNTINQINRIYKSKKIKIYHIEKRILNGEARNIGVYKSSKKSKFIAFCDSDDWWKKDKLKKQIDFIQKQNGKICCTNYDFYNPNNKNIIKNYFKIPFTTINFSMLSYKNLIGTSSVLVEKNLFLEIGGFPIGNFFYSFEDYFLWLKLANKDFIYFLDENLTVYRDDRQNSATKYSRSFVSQRCRLMLYYLCKLEIKNLFTLGISYLKILKSIIFNEKKNEYINLL
jgi:teichuronic acid biosynthesis glycosyltransferase TuaG